MRPDVRKTDGSGAESGGGAAAPRLQVRVAGLVLDVSVERDGGPPGKEGWPVPHRPERAPEHWKWFSPAEQGILDVLAGLEEGEWLAMGKLAAVLGESPDGDLRVVLRNLQARGVVVGAPGRGWRLSLDGDGQG